MSNIKRTYNPTPYKYNPRNIIKEESNIRAREAYTNSIKGRQFEESRNQFTDQTAQQGLGILGAASLAFPAIAPVAAAASVGYGVYKLGESFKLW
jgi:hypothetical protein